MTANGRPAHIDAAILKYMPGLENLSLRLTKSAKPTDVSKELLSKTYEELLSKWETYREDGGIWLWMQWRMRSVWSGMGKRKKVHDRIFDDFEAVAGGDGNVGRDVAGFKEGERDGNRAGVSLASIPANQEDHVELSKAMERIGAVKYGDDYVKFLMGYTHKEIADGLVSPQRVEFRTKAAAAAARKGLED